MGETLIQFLESLEFSVIPGQYYKQVLDASSNISSCRQLLIDISKTYSYGQVNFDVFYYIMAFIREILKFSTSTPEQLCINFSIPNL